MQNMQINNIIEHEPNSEILKRLLYRSWEQQGELRRVVNLQKNEIESLRQQITNTKTTLTATLQSLSMVEQNMIPMVIYLND